MSNALQIVPDSPDTAALSAESAALVADAQALVVSDAASYAFAGEFGKGIRSLQKKITDFFEPHTQRAHAAWKGLTDERAAQLEPTERAVKIVARKMTDWKSAEDRRAEAERREREAAALKLEEDRRIQEAIDAEADGDIAGAEAALSEPIAAPVIAPQPLTPKVAGVAAAKRWTYDANNVDIAAVVKYIAGVEKLAHPELLCILTASSADLRRLITSMRERFSVPGINAYQDPGISFGRK